MKILFAALILFASLAHAQAPIIHIPADPATPNCIDTRLLFSDATNNMFAGKNGACYVKAKGDELSKAVLDFKAGKTVKDSGATIQPMYQLAEDYQKAEKACVVNKLAGEPAR